MSSEEQEKVLNHSYLVPALFGLTNNGPKGEIGLELETIGKKLPGEFVKTKLWTAHPDQSVKPRPGEQTAEYVLMQPVGRPKVEQAIDELLEEFQNANTWVAEGRLSNSTHVHINARDLSMQQVYTWLALYFIFEEMLVRWCGEDRVGNLFCLRARDAEGLTRCLAKCAKEDRWNNLMSESYRYAAVNCTALGKYGSLEFRALRGTAQKDVIMLWVATLLAIKDKSLEYKNPVEVVDDFSRRSPFGMARHVLPTAMADFMIGQSDFQNSLWDGACLVQDFAFAAKWQNKVVKEGPKPRAKKKTVDLGIAPSWVNMVTLDSLGNEAQPAPAFHHSLTANYIGSINSSGSLVHEEDTDGDLVVIKISDFLRQACVANGWKIGWYKHQSKRYLAVLSNTGGLMQWVRNTHFHVV